MILSEVVELFETDSHKQANDHLKVGWVLISTHVRDYDNLPKRDERTVYCLGWLKEKGKAVFPTQYLGREFPSG